MNEPIRNSGYGRLPEYIKQVALTMKITAFLLLAGCMHLSATSFSQKVTLTAKRTPLAEVLTAVQQQTALRVIYNDRYILRAQPVTITAKEMPLERFLEQVLTNQSLTFAVREKTIIIGKDKASPKNQPTDPSNSVPQERVITGNVTDESGMPLEGVTVTVKGTQTKVITDVDGNYQVGVPANGILLTFTTIGFEAAERSIGKESKVNITMKTSVSDLDEVVVIGYGTQRKSDLTGSVVRVSMGDKENQANVNLLQALSGTAAGVNIQATGLAGGEPNVSVRGQTSLSANDNPLVVVDGIIYNGAISDINTNDVEAIDILKDASAAAVYGSRSANGVMLITTKKGKTDKPNLSFNMYYGYQDMTNNPMKVMNAEQYAIRLVDYFYQQDLYKWYYTKPTSAEGKPMRPDVTDRELVAARLRTQEERDNYLAGKSIDWVDEVTRRAPIQNYDLSLSQQTERNNYFVSASYTDEQGILSNDAFKRFTLRTNFESKVTDWLTFGLNSSYSYRDYSGVEASFNNARRASPLANNKIGAPDYDMFLTGETYMPYPFNNLNVDNSDIRNNLFVVGRAKVTVPWVKGLTNELNYSNTYSANNNNSFYPINTPEGSANKGEARKHPSQERNWILNNIVSYLGDFGNHQINGTLLFSRENRYADNSTISNTGFENPILGYNNIGMGTLPVVESSAWEENSLSYMGRVSYSYKDRYLVTGTVRKDGFSGFAANKKFATFPSLSLGWVLSEEPFFDNVKDVFLKVRLSYGKNGNQGIGRYSSFSRMVARPYVYGATTANGVLPTSLGNADLGWETTGSYNLGVDFGFLNRRITGSVDIYNAKTTDVLVRRALPPASGYPNIWANIGAIGNRGGELEMRTINLQDKLRWESSFVFSLNRSEITQLYGGEADQDLGNSWFVGEPISAIYDYEMAGGVWSEYDLYNGRTLMNWYPGQFRYVDQNGDGVIDPNSDRTIIGYEAPNYRFSIGNNLSYSNFNLSFLLNSIQGGNGFYLMDNSRAVNVAWNADDVFRINATAVRPYWTPDNGVDNATGIYNTPVRQSGIYESRSFVRLQDITFAYRFAPSLLKPLKLKACQIYVSAKNLYTWTNWSGWDPEVGLGNSADQDTPLSRNVTAGFRLTF
ncbi:TonB-dependent receptor [Parapedobacter pyrenivorans]|uniref:TonB-dependent receptor n=1 Tax=Parapedobacter pyrenivorans TaxID=1305674 RepID=UPI00333FDCB1